MPMRGRGTAVLSRQCTCDMNNIIADSLQLFIHALHQIVVGGRRLHRSVVDRL